MFEKCPSGYTIALNMTKIANRWVLQKKIEWYTSNELPSLLEDPFCVRSIGVKSSLTIQYVPNEKKLAKLSLFMYHKTNFLANDLDTKMFLRNTQPDKHTTIGNLIENTQNKGHFLILVVRHINTIESQ